MRKRNSTLHTHTHTHRGTHEQARREILSTSFWQGMIRLLGHLYKGNSTIRMHNLLTFNYVPYKCHQDLRYFYVYM